MGLPAPAPPPAPGAPGPCLPLLPTNSQEPYQQPPQRRQYLQEWLPQGSQPSAPPPTLSQDLSEDGGFATPREGAVPGTSTPHPAATPSPQEQQQQQRQRQQQQTLPHYLTSVAQGLAPSSSSTAAGPASSEGRQPARTGLTPLARTGIILSSTAAAVARTTAAEAPPSPNSRWVAYAQEEVGRVIRNAALPAQAAAESAEACSHTEQQLLHRQHDVHPGVVGTLSPRSAAAAAAAVAHRQRRPGGEGCQEVSGGSGSGGGSPSAVPLRLQQLEGEEGEGELQTLPSIGATIPASPTARAPSAPGAEGARLPPAGQSARVEEPCQSRSQQQSSGLYCSWSPAQCILSPGGCAGAAFHLAMSLLAPKGQQGKDAPPFATYPLCSGISEADCRAGILTPLTSGAGCRLHPWPAAAAACDVQGHLPPGPPCCHPCQGPDSGSRSSGGAFRAVAAPTPGAPCLS